MTDNKPKASPIGTTVTVPAKEPVTVVRPDGTQVTVAPVAGEAHYVLDVAGSFTVGDLVLEAK